MKVSRKVGRRKHSRSSSISRRRLRNKKSRSGYKKRYAKTQRGGARSRKYGDKRGKRFHRGGTDFIVPSFIKENDNLRRVGTFNFVTITDDKTGNVQEEKKYDVYYDRLSGFLPNIVLLRRGKHYEYDVIFYMTNEYDGWVVEETGETEPDLLNPEGPQIPKTRSYRKLNMARYPNMAADTPLELEAKGQTIKYGSIKSGLFSSEDSTSRDSMYTFPVCPVNKQSMEEIVNKIVELIRTTD